MSSESDKMQYRLQQVFHNPQTQSAVVDAVVHNKPSGWGRRSIAPYYKDKFGEEMKSVLVAMMADREDRLYDYKYFRTKFGLSKESLYLRINQSMRYVCDKMDDIEHTLSKFCEMLVVERKTNVGIMLRFRPESREGNISEFVPKQVQCKDEVPTWKKALVDYLETAQPGDAPFLKDKLALTPEEIKQVKDSLLGVAGILSNVTSYSVKVIRVNEEGLS